MSAQFIDFRTAAPTAKEGEFPASTRVLHETGATVVVFRFGPGQMLKEHHAPHPITVQVVEGEVEFTAAGTAHTLTPGVGIYVPQDGLHSVVSHNGAIMVLTLHTGGGN